MAVRNESEEKITSELAEKGSHALFLLPQCDVISVVDWCCILWDHDEFKVPKDILWHSMRREIHLRKTVSLYVFLAI